MKNYFIIHGSFGSSQENWFPWLEQTLNSRGGGVQVINLDFPIGENKQTYANWEMVLNSVRRFITEESVFFCHSISCIFLVKYCIRNNIKIGKAIFVSGFNQYLGLDEDFDDVNCTMYTTRCSEFSELCGERICYYSNNDPYVKLEKLKEFVTLVNGKPVVVADGGHFNKAAGYLEFNDLLKHI